MKKISSLSRRRPYVFSFYLKRFGEKVDVMHDFPCMTHSFYCESLSFAYSHVKKLLLEYHYLGIDMVAFFEDSLETIDVDSIVQRYDTQISLDF